MSKIQKIPIMLLMTAGLGAVLAPPPLVASEEPRPSSGREEQLLSKLSNWRDSSPVYLESYGVFTGEFFSNLKGGNRTGSVWEGLFDFGVAVDLETSLGWRGASLHVDAFWIMGDDPTEKLVGDFNVLSNIAAFNTVRLHQAWWEQKWDGGRFVLRLGQIAADDHFMVSEYALLFLNSGFGPIPTQSANTNVPIFPLGALGLWSSFAPTENVFLQWGIYDGDAGEEERNDDGFDYQLGGAEGYALFFEGDRTFMWRGREGVLKLGGFYHTGDFEDFKRGSTVEGNHSFYFIIDQVLIAEADREQGLGMFFRVGYSPSEERNTVSFYTDVGFTYTGLLPERKEDTFGLAFSFTDFSNSYLKAIRETGQRVSGQETVFELTYQASLTPWLVIQPDLQIIIDPHESRDHAWIAGLRMETTF